MSTKYKVETCYTTEAYVLQDARIQYLGTWFALEDANGQYFLAFSKNRWQTGDEVDEVDEEDLEDELLDRDYLLCPEETTRVTDEMIEAGEDEYFLKGMEDEADECNVEDDSKPLDVACHIPTLQKRLHESHICEILAKSPHPNVVRYYGCHVDEENHIRHLYFEKLHCTLDERLMDDSRSPLDKTRCMQGIEAGIGHMHSLGLIHNDLAPRNVMLREDDTLVIIDFDLTLRDGESLGESNRFRPGGVYYDTVIANCSPQYERQALDETRKWLNEWTPPPPPRHYDSEEEEEEGEHSGGEHPERKE